MKELESEFALTCHGIHINFTSVVSAGWQCFAELTNSKAVMRN